MGDEGAHAPGDDACTETGSDEGKVSRGTTGPHESGEKGSTGARHIARRRRERGEMRVWGRAELGCGPAVIFRRRGGAPV